MLASTARILLEPRFQRISYRCAIVLYLSILIFGSIPGARADIAHYAPGGVLHSVAYSVLTALLFSGQTGNRAERAVTAVLTIMALGAFDEYVQSFFPYRSANVMDWAVDVIAGISSAALLWIVWPKLVDSSPCIR